MNKYIVGLQQMPFWVKHQLVIPYSGKVWQGESLANLANRQRFAKLKPSKLVVIIITLWLDLFIRQTFLCQTLKRSKFDKVSPRQTFPLYGICIIFIWSHKKTIIIQFDFLQHEYAIVLS